MVEVSDRAHLKPLLRAVTFPQHAWVLAISIGACRLVEVSADLPPHEVSVPGLPRDFGAALGKRSHLEQGAMGRSDAMSESALLNRYARSVDAPLRPLLSGHERPLIVAASEPLGSIVRAVSSYPHTAEATIPGSADHTPDHELADARAAGSTRSMRRRSRRSARFMRHGQVRAAPPAISRARRGRRPSAQSTR